MNDAHSTVAQAVTRFGAASVARVLDVSRSALLSYVAGASRAATRLVIEQRVDRLHNSPALQAKTLQGAMTALEEQAKARS